MKLRFFLLCITIFVLSSCGSKKQIINRTPQKPVVVDDHEIESSTEVPTVTPKKKKKKSYESIVKTTQDYVEKFAPIAVREMYKYKIPASITLAQGILESGSGRSNLAIRSNNHFGIKCHRGWKGKSVTHDDDRIAECFRKYKHPERSYEDHSKFLTSRKRYSKLFRLRITDYKGWAYGLKRAGYATDKKYPQKLIALIKKYDLTKYDRERYKPSTPSTKKTETVIVTQDDDTNTRFFYKVIKGDTLYSIARKFKTSVKSLKLLNGLKDNTLSIGQELILKK
ncbi:glucosaminidase domain-containing protein [Tenacibaculum jejuense]|uniref:Peptidoglycan hydrolase n=1 Tax=Tenacibaculum jejuense TaxID=584609 RepID=A0A238UF36_9FLAO|nr:glucosaminidase domain-containing protein [Tenacibaculum jejuense]SNR17188.1 Putative muramidase precursor [Tenacibaculum jejuense]